MKLCTEKKLTRRSHLHSSAVCMTLFIKYFADFIADQKNIHLMRLKDPSEQ